VVTYPPRGGRPGPGGRSSGRRPLAAAGRRKSLPSSLLATICGARRARGRAPDYRASQTSRLAYWSPVCRRRRRLLVSACAATSSLTAPAADKEGKLYGFSIASGAGGTHCDAPECVRGSARAVHRLAAAAPPQAEPSTHPAERCTPAAGRAARGPIAVGQRLGSENRRPTNIGRLDAECGARRN
jgi:hypothetical protein